MPHRGFVFAVTAGALLLLVSSAAESAPLNPSKLPTLQPKRGTTPIGPATTSGGRFVLLPNATGSMVQDTTTGRVWERVPSGTKLAWSAAKAACDGKTLGGQTDWRLPRVEELQALFAGPVEQPLPADHPFTVAGTYWSSTDTQLTSAMTLLAANGNVFHELMAELRGVWCVRGGGNTAYPNSNPRFKVVGKDVEDAQTARVWARHPEPQATWYGARLACRAKGPEWRMATRDEVVGLLDLNAPESPKLPVGHPFVNTWPKHDQNPVWTLDSVDASKARAVRLQDGAVLELPKTEGGHTALCIQMAADAAWPAGPVGRFQVTQDGLAVLDQETALLWERSPVAPKDKWAPIQAACAARTTGGQGGWRQPTIDEFKALVDLRATTAAKLPPGHPFLAAEATTYWTGSEIAGTAAHTLRLDIGQAASMSKSGATMPGWCVRTP